ncbi:carbon-nitrogen hydrolase family protein [Fibrella sp. WM1]|uniref:carbon-nitrogen hydrolase family protein n=1 Tax=Fibrella musci TaxID=3242485 RepID=UPI0035205D32
MSVKTVNVALAQLLCLDSDRSGNLLRIENALIEAKAKQAEIVVFPESSILGWINPEAHSRATPIPGADSDHLCRLAKKYQLYICIGLDEKDGTRLFDSAILIDDTGTILLKHRKINVLPDLMSPSYAIGKGVTSVNTKFGKVGVMICADSFQEDLLQSMASQKPALLLIPYGWAAPESKWPAHGKELAKVVQNAARTIRCPVIGTDLVGQVSHGPWAGHIYGGQSVACDKNGNVLMIGKDRERDIMVVKVTLN